MGIIHRPRERRVAPRATAHPHGLKCALSAIFQLTRLGREKKGKREVRLAIRWLRYGRCEPGDSKSIVTTNELTCIPY